MRELNQWISQNERRFRLITISLFDQKIFLLKLRIKYYFQIFKRVVQW